MTKKTQFGDWATVEQKEEIQEHDAVGDALIAVNTPPHEEVNPSNSEVGQQESVGPKSELDHINAIERMNTNFMFIFGSSQRGKTVITASILNFLSSADAEGGLSVVRGRTDKTDHGDRLLKQIRRKIAARQFPDRTVLVGDDEPIYVNVKFTPRNSRDHKALNLTFLEMPGDTLQKVDAPDGGMGDLPSSINAFLRADRRKVKLSFILVTDHQNAPDDDQLMASFIEYIIEENATFAEEGFLLLVSKWDEYDGGLSVGEFVKLNMPITYGKLYDKRHSMSSFSIGEVDQAAGSRGGMINFLKVFNPEPSKRVINWMWKRVSGKPLYTESRASWLARTINRFI